MAVHLVRHADAVDRHRHDGPDETRGLSPRGRRRAGEIALDLAPGGVSRILTSPAVRCVETVQPLADAADVVVERHPALAEGARLQDTWALLEELDRNGHPAGAGDVVVCSHGDVLPAVLDRLARRGVPVSGTCSRVSKGSVWTVAAGPDGRITTPRPVPT